MIVTTSGAAQEQTQIVPLGRSIEKLDSGQDDPPSDDLYKKTSEFTKRQIIRGTGGQYPNNWNFSVEVSKIEAGKWNTRDVNGNLVPKCAYLVQSDISITKSKFVKQFQLDIWHAPLLADATIEQGAHLEHSGPEHLKGEVLEVHRENEIGTDATLEVGTGQAALQAGVHTTNNTSYDFNVYGGLKTQHSVSEKRQKITCEVYERKLEQERDGGSGVPHKVRVYALIVCPQAVALDISAEIEFTWRKKGWPPSSLKNPVFYKGSWCTIPLPEVPWRPEELDFSTWGQEEYKNVAGNRCVTGEVSY
ncbi:hypothetical protein EJ04DRAFT_516100 [Polyplosphaeria fusca]|uniref:Uncharacterized protein n=1 Tax=Polyplosphaeria fusca TaxID=682080 RepID=A0A9P4QKW7_9PLEO|nr:hypothetical protein EJ04DRAFT_516100 [Polyplosphaeria fusca]